MTQTSRRPLALALALLLLVGLLVASGPAVPGEALTYRIADVDAAAEREFLSEINRERRARGLSSLAASDGVTGVARDWSGTMASERTLRHRPDLAAPFVGDWRAVGENVGVGSSVSSLHRAFMNSPGHRDNVLGNYTSAGVGVVTVDGRIWVTVNFVRGDDRVASRYLDAVRAASSSDYGGSYSDVAGTVHESTIEALEEHGIALGCGGGRYCPDRALTRAEMAVFVTRALGLPRTAERFRDVSSGHPYASHIGAIAQADITMGCNPPTNDRFCPDGSVTRQQMASFLTRALDLDPTRERFRDVDASNVHHRDIGGLATTGVTRGCNPPNNDRFCPANAVTRGQMASFLARAFGL